MGVKALTNICMQSLLEQAGCVISSVRSFTLAEARQTCIRYAQAMLPENKDTVRVIRARGRTKSSFAVETVRSVNFQTGLSRSCSSMTRHLIVIPPFQFCFFFYRLSKTRQQNVSEIDSSLGSAGFDCLPKTAWCGLSQS